CRIPRDDDSMIECQAPLSLRVFLGDWGDELAALIVQAGSLRQPGAELPLGVRERVSWIEDELAAIRPDLRFDLVRIEMAATAAPRRVGTVAAVGGCAHIPLVLFRPGGARLHGHRRAYIAAPAEVAGDEAPQQVHA